MKKIILSLLLCIPISESYGTEVPHAYYAYDQCVDISQYHKDFQLIHKCGKGTYIQYCTSSDNRDENILMVNEKTGKLLVSGADQQPDNWNQIMVFYKKNKTFVGSPDPIYKIGENCTESSLKFIDDIEKDLKLPKQINWDIIVNRFKEDEYEKARKLRNDLLNQFDVYIGTAKNSRENYKYAVHIRNASEEAYYKTLAKLNRKSIKTLSAASHAKRIKDSISDAKKEHESIELTAIKCPPREMNNYWSDCVGSDEYLGVSTYIGYWKNDKPNGKGTMIYQDDLGIFRGVFKDGYPIGIASGNQGARSDFISSFKNGVPNGFGIETSKGINGEKREYIGNYKDGKPDGRGVTKTTFNQKGQSDSYFFLTADEDEIIIETCNCIFVDGMANGQGEVLVRKTKKNNEKITGTVEYLGPLKNGKLHGLGSITIKSYSQKEYTLYGDFKENFITEGTFKSTSGHKQYIGSFKSYSPNGQGITIVKDEYVFSGQHQMGKFVKGFIEYNNGETYEGEFRNEEPHGEGIYIFTNGEQLEGVWVNGEFSFFKDVKNSDSEEINRTAEKNIEPLIPASSGTAFSIEESGYLITNYHVVNGCSEIKVPYQGGTLKANLISFDLINDLALIKIDKKLGNVIPIENSQPYLMQDIFVAGYPFGKDLSTSLKITKGIVSSLSGLANNFSRIQIDAALQPGNSGGPIYNDNGNLVAVAVSKLDLEYMVETYATIPENINFGIKSSVLLAFLESNNIDNLPSPSSSIIQREKLAKIINNSTYYLSCLMSDSKIQELRSEKVIYNFDN